MEHHRVSKNVMELMGAPFSPGCIVSLFDIRGHGGASLLHVTETERRDLNTAAYLEFLHKNVIEILLSSLDFGSDKSQTSPPTSLYYLFQSKDEAINIRSVSWQSQKEWSNIVLVPDLYYFNARGYVNFLPAGDPALPPWSERTPKIFWRGFSTGRVTSLDNPFEVGFSLETLDQLPRYQLCRIAKSLGGKADVGMVGVAQARPGQYEAATARLVAEGLMKAFVPVDEMAAYKFLVDIDGNASAWNVIQRLRTGCCIIKVESDWVQWYSNAIEPWRHFVPVKGDLSDLAEKVDWCLTHDRDAEQIAENGRAFGLSMDFETEMKTAALRILNAAAPLVQPGPEFEILQLALERVAVSDLRMRATSVSGDRFEFKLKEDMLLLTHHGTVLGRNAVGEIVQIDPAGDLEGAIVLSKGRRRGQEALSQFQVALSNNVLTLERNSRYLCALADQKSTVCDRRIPGQWESFTLIARASLS